MKYMLIAGEASGDLHASALMESLQNVDPEAHFIFLGGDKMAKVACHEPIVDYRDMAYMGFTEVIKNIAKVRENLNTAKNTLSLYKPDCLILVDYPSFNLKVAEEAKRLGIKVFYYISPKVWAWKEWRVRKIKRLVDRMFCILPFEVEFYAKRHDYKVDYVGNPSVFEIDSELANLGTREDFLLRNRLRDKPIIAILPGSRRSELRNNLPIMLAAARQFPQYQAVVSKAPGLDSEFYAPYGMINLVENQTIELLARSHAAIVTSGTATLETALTGTPQVACYRGNGTKLTYDIMKKLLKINYVTLPNLIADRQVIPELLQHLCTPDAIGEALAPLMPQGEARTAMLDGYSEIRRRLGTRDAAATTAQAIHEELRNSGFKVLSEH